MKEPTYHTTIPPCVRYSRNLYPATKLLYGEIQALCDERGYCWASNQFFAQLYGVGKKAVSRWISQLEKWRYIRVEVSQDKGNLRRIYVVDYPPEKGKVYSETEPARLTSEVGCPPKKSEETDPLLIENNIDYNDRVHRTSSPMGIVISEDRESLEGAKRMEGVSAKEGGFRSPHPPVAPAPLPQRKKPKQSFTKPSVKEAEDYMLGQSTLCPNALTARTQALRFVNYYESNGWKVGRNAMQDWRAAANNWLLNAQTYQPAKPPAHNHLHSGGPKDYSIPL